MNTERLVELLSANLEPVRCVQLGRILMIAMLTGGAAAILMMLATVGVRNDLDSLAHLEWTALKMLFAVSVIGTAAPLLLRSMRPGLEKEIGLALIFLPFFVATAAALVMFLFVNRKRGARCFVESHQCLRRAAYSALHSLRRFHSQPWYGRLDRAHLHS